MPDASRPVGDLTDDQIRKRLRVPVQEAAQLLGISPEAVRSRLYRGTLDKETGTDGTVYVRLQADQLLHDDEQTADQTQPNTELVGELRARVEDLREQLSEEREARRRADTIIAQLARANEEQARTIRELEAPSEPPSDERESPQTVEGTPDRAEPRPSTGGAVQETTRPPAPSALTSRLGMSAWALAVGAIATLLAWFFATAGSYWPFPSRPFPGSPVIFYALVPRIFFRSDTLYVALPVLVPLLSGLWAGSTKRPSLPWFTSPHRWLRRGGRSTLRTALFASGIPAWVGFSVAFYVFIWALFALPDVPGLGGWVAGYSVGFFALTVAFGLLVVPLLSSLAFLSGALLGNALRRVGLLGTPKELPQGEEEVDQEEEVWSPRNQAQWGLAGSIITAIISAFASVVAASIN